MGFLLEENNERGTKEVNRNLQEAFTEVYEILKITPVELTSKIPVKFKQVIEENRATDYRIQVTEDFEESELKSETIVILGLIYRDFFADPEEREELQLKDAEEIRKLEQEMSEKYDIENVFQKRKQKIADDTEEQGLVVYKDKGFIKKLFNLIKGIFKNSK